MAGVYISHPFCQQKCTYCNFASGVFPGELEHRYLTALQHEIKRHTWKWHPETIYFGGGSPDRIGAGTLAGLLALIPGRPWREATIEAAPGSLSADKIAAWRDAGIDRVSLGAQSFVKAELAQTGRKHTAETIAGDVALLRAAGIRKINIDLIAGLPRQTPASWRESLDWIERLAPEHVSVYMLEVDMDSRLGLEILCGGKRYGAAKLPTEDVVVELYETAVERLARMGLARYEISNFARAGGESIHNRKYWLLEPYIGFGADAHSLDGGLRWANVETAEEYVSRWERGEFAREEPVAAKPGEERFFAGLRLSDGITLTSEESRRFAAPIGHFVEAGLMEKDGSRLRLTPRGMLVSNELFQEFIEA